MGLSKTLVISVSVLMMSAFSVQAQVPYTCVTKGAVLEYGVYNESDEISTYTRQVIKDVSDLSNGSYDIRIENSTIKKPGQKKDGDDTFITMTEIREGGIHSYPSGSEGMVNVIEGLETLLVPNRLAVGYQLPIGDIRVDVEGLSTVASITENEIIGREEVTTPAGTFKCYVLKQTLTTSVMGFGITTTTKTWLCRGVGAVKTQAMMGGRMISRTELVTCNM